jgi:hypothetical protein
VCGVRGGRQTLRHGDGRGGVDPDCGTMGAVIMHVVLWFSFTVVSPESLKPGQPAASGCEYLQNHWLVALARVSQKLWSCQPPHRRRSEARLAGPGWSASEYRWSPQVGLPGLPSLERLSGPLAEVGSLPPVPGRRRRRASGLGLVHGTATEMTLPRAP